MNDTHSILEWINSLNLSKKCRNLQRDFSDAVLMSEVAHHFYPKLIDLHNYEQGLKIETKIYNWNTLNQKFFKKIGLPLDSNIILNLSNSNPGTIEKLLIDFRNFLENKSQPIENEIKPKKKIKPIPLEPLNESEREILIEKIFESSQQKIIINILEEKYKKLKELMLIKDSQIIQRKK